MRPRIEIDALDVDTPADEVIGAVAMAGFSRLPIHEGDLDHIIGFVYTKDLLLRQHMGWPIELRKLVRPALLVPESLRIDKLLERFRQKRTQMAIVLDEFGGTQGLVTMEDVLEELVGEIHDEHCAERQQQIVARDESSWFVDAGLPLHELLERLDMAGTRGSLPADVSTVGGLVLALLGRIPATGERATWEGLTLEVVAMDGRRLERILICRLGRPPILRASAALILAACGTRDFRGPRGPSSPARGYERLDLKLCSLAPASSECHRRRRSVGTGLDFLGHNQGFSESTMTPQAPAADRTPRFQSRRHTCVSIGGGSSIYRVSAYPAMRSEKRGKTERTITNGLLWWALF